MFAFSFSYFGNHLEANVTAIFVLKPIFSKVHLVVVLRSTAEPCVQAYVPSIGLRQESRKLSKVLPEA